MASFTINRAILHVVDSKGTSTLSKQELDIDSETCYQFVQKHVKKLQKQSEAREACFTAESAVYGLVRAYQKDELHFTDLSHKLCERLSGIISGSDEIPAADILIVDFEDRKNRYLAILKLNYIECFTHKLADGDNQIVKNTNVLPFTSGKVEEACLIPYEPMVLRILEKPYNVNGEESNYFSELFLECDTDLSKKEIADVISQAAADINQKYFESNIESAARFSQALIAEAELADEDEGIHIENVIKRAFEENEQAAGEFLEAAKEAGLPHDIKMDEKFIRRQFGTHKFKADNGIEIKFPAELLEQAETIQFISNPDGTVSVTMRNLRRSES